METTKIFRSSSSLLSPAKTAGLIVTLALLTGCQSGKSPEQVTLDFWQDLAQNRLVDAKKLVTDHSQHLVNINDIDKLSTINVGPATVEDSNATVETTIKRNARIITFNTVLVKEDVWKVDYVGTQLNITLLPLGDVVRSLENLGGVFAKQLEQNIPEIQKQMESLGDTIKKQIEQFGRSLEKPDTNSAPKPRQSGSI